MNVCIFCSANDLDDKYVEPAKEFARLLAENGHTLVWGGDDTGLMKIMADGVSEGGGRIIAVTAELLKHKVREKVDELVVARNLPERQMIMLEKADVTVMMVGGIGALREALDYLTLRKHKKHDKMLMILNTNGFYAGLRNQLERMDREGFLPLPLEELVIFAESPKDVIKYFVKVY